MLTLWQQLLKSIKTHPDPFATLKGQQGCLCREQPVYHMHFISDLLGGFGFSSQTLPRTRPMLPDQLTLLQMSSTRQGKKTPAATSRYVEGQGQAKCAFPPPSPPDLPVPGAHWSALDTLVPPAHMHTGVPARSCISRRQREAGGSRSHASRMWFKEQVPTSLTLTVPVLLRGQPDLPLIYSDHRTNGLNKILHDWVTPFLAFIRHAEERWFTLPE